MLDDMAFRPNFGLNELNIVFSTLVVRLILNFILMYRAISPNNGCHNNHSFFFLVLQSLQIVQKAKCLNLKHLLW
ncbi:hypothetical protein Sjap_014940 [Stephania japonica]|uniref:Uncharacterized protein n=1 Tax=Stephania japonica TaxID=461633 RepID=A0AAP0IIB6_9MAGN